MENRLSRGGYWIRWLVAFAISVVITLLTRGGSTGAAIIDLIVSLAVSIFMIVMGVKRMHDVDKSGWFILIPIYNLVLTLTDGTPGPNRFGNDPKGRGGEQESQSESWTCAGCGAKNASFDKEKCYKCGAPKTPSTAAPAP